MFFIFVVPVVGLLIYGYERVTDIVQKNPMNPLGLILDCNFGEDTIILNLINPTNESYQISITNMRIRGRYANPVLIASGDFIGKVIYISPNSVMRFEYNASLNMNVFSIIKTWKKLGGSITITMDYEELKNGISGVLICKKALDFV
mgnify:CR=1 FL=1